LIYKYIKMDFKSNKAYKAWLAYGHASGEFAKTPGHQSVSIGGKPKAVKHANGGVPNIPTWNYPSSGTPIFRNTSEIPANTFGNGGPKDGLYTYNGVKYKLQDGVWYKNINNTYHKLSQGDVEKRTAVLNKNATPVHTVKKSYGSQAEVEDLIIQELNSAGITNPYMQQAMMAIIMSEGGLRGTPENMNYSKERLPEIWDAFSTTGKAVPKGQGKNYYNKLAEEYAKNPKKLAGFVYGKKLGNESPEEGWIYRGRGFNQLTGKGSYKEIGDEIGVDLVNNPELLDIDPQIQAKVAAVFMKRRMQTLSRLDLNKPQYQDLTPYVDYNNINNIEDAAYLLTRANAGFGKMPSEEVINKRLNTAKGYQFATTNFKPANTTGQPTTSIPTVQNKNTPQTTNPENKNKGNISYLSPQITPVGVFEADNTQGLISQYYQQNANQPDYLSSRDFNLSENKIAGLDQLLQRGAPQFKYGGIIFNDGGQMSMPITEFGEGGTHEENPLGGIPQGIGKNGQPNLVEEGELKVKDPSTGEDFIITNNDDMVMTKEIATKYNIPNKYVGKKLNKIGREILRLDSKRVGDHIEENSKNRELAGFISAHKELTEMQNAKDAQKKEDKFLKEITKLNEEYPEYMQALMASNQPQGPSPEEQMMMEQQMMAEQGGMEGQPMAPEMGMMPMTYGGTMYDFGGVMRGIGTGLKAASGLASMIPGVGTLVGAGMGAVGAGLQNVGTNANIGDVLGEVALGGASAAVPGIGGMLGNITNSQQFGNGGPGEPVTEPEYRTKTYKLGDKDVGFYELPEASQRLLDYKYGWTGTLNPETGERTYQGVNNPGWNFYKDSYLDAVKKRQELGLPKKVKMTTYKDPETGQQWSLPAGYLQPYTQGVPVFTEEEAGISAPNVQRNGGTRGEGGPYPPELEKLLSRRKDILSQSPYASQRGNKKSFDVWKKDLSTVENALIKKSQELGIKLSTEDLANPPGYVAPEYRTNYGVTSTGEPISFKYGGNMFDNGNPFQTAFSGVNSMLGASNVPGQMDFNTALGYLSQGNNSNNNVIKQGPQEGQLKELDYNQGIGSVLSMAPAAYNIYQGLQNPEQTSADRYYNPLEAPQFDYSEANKEGRRLYSGLQKGLRGAGNPGAYAANLASTYGRMQEGFAKNIQEQENRQAMLDYQTSAQNAQMKTMSTQAADQLNMAQKFAQQAMLAQGMSDIGAIGQQMEANKMGLAYTNMMAPDYQLKYNSLGKQFVNLLNKKD